MQCPFLRKMNVKYCGRNRRTMIPLGSDGIASDRCSRPEHRDCPLLRDLDRELTPSDACPYLSVADVHYCNVASVRKLVTCNQAAISRCTSDGYRYCRHFLAVDDPYPDDGRDADDDMPVPMPSSLAYAPNHLWLDRGEGQTWHVGVDAFLTRALGHLDAVAFPNRGDACRPLARVTVNGATIDLAFPNALQCIETNSHLIAEPDEARRDPYGRGWLFAGLIPGAAGPHDALERGLRRGAAARRWMERECTRLALVTREYAGHRDAATVHNLHVSFFSWPHSSHGITSSSHGLTGGYRGS